jgi:hypothetical protein
MRNQLKPSLIDTSTLFIFEDKELERGGWTILYKVEKRNPDGTIDYEKLLIGAAYKSDVSTIKLPFLRYFDYKDSSGLPYASYDDLIDDLQTLLGLGPSGGGGAGTDLGYVAATGEVTSSTGSNAIITVMSGDSGAGGLRGLVPDQSAGDANRALFGDGLWKSVAGGITVVNKSFVDSGYVANDGESVIVDATGGVTTIALPAANLSANFSIRIKKKDSVNNVIVDPNGSDTVDGAATYTLTSLYESVQVQCDGVEWFII